MKKVLKFDRLFELYDFIENIDNKSFKDIEIMSNTLNEYIIKEGLIKTYPLNKSIDILEKKFKNIDVSLGEDNEIYIEGKIELNKLKTLSNTLGYHISTIIQNDNIIDEKSINIDKEYMVCIEPKYDIEIDVPTIIYHSTLDIYLNKILKNGLYPKSKNKISKHPDRIYFSLSFEDALIFCKFLEKEYDKKASVIKINTKNLNNKFYSDINFRERGIYTLNNIPPNNIEI
jgi:hypothetical protein